jgi:hypothetical protein
MIKSGSSIFLVELALMLQIHGDPPSNPSLETFIVTDDVCGFIQALHTTSDFFLFPIH